RTHHYPLSLHDALPIYTCNACRRCTSRGVDEEQQLQHVFCRRIGTLHHEDIRTANVLVDAHEDFAVRKPTAGDLASLDAQMARRSEEHTSELQSRENLV